MTLLLPEYYKGVIGLAKSGQSPIDLNDNIIRRKRYPTLILNGHWLNDGDAILGNDGSVATVILGGNRIPSTITGGPLFNDVYEYFICNFRWGEENCNGSEHTINGTWLHFIHEINSFLFSFPYILRTSLFYIFFFFISICHYRFSMEAQMVHWNRKYPSFDDCLNRKDGICIMSFLFLVPFGRSENNPQLEKITENLKHVTDAGSEINIPANALCWMRWATRCERYYTYQGSYNEGPCSILGYPECVTWIIFPMMINISPSQVDAFRMLKDDNGHFIKNNCKQIQLLRGRRIFLGIQ
ncbi:carbonic anhydrase-like isoform X1 [Polistes fuscatus]|uniref:carbonic anhydrase-like isoform X1 n=1 Tax=Polistes fuscatus TaxID=30207 RepID=UPI001CA83778|nr:carbonic anhydrase-like isoform X1 [Polistes fuscatus]